MQIYRHALLLVENETDGLLLLEQAEGLAKEMVNPKTLLMQKQC